MTVNWAAIQQEYDSGMWHADPDSLIIAPVMILGGGLVVLHADWQPDWAAPGTVPYFILRNAEETWGLITNGIGDFWSINELKYVSMVPNAAGLLGEKTEMTPEFTKEVGGLISRILTGA